MAEQNDRKGLLDGREAHTRPYTPPNEYDEGLFHETGKSPKEKFIMYLFILFVIIMVMITIILSLYRGSKVDSTYVLLGVSITYECGQAMVCIQNTHGQRSQPSEPDVLLKCTKNAIGLVELVLVYWSRSGELPAEKLWFLYFVGICIVLESVLTNVLLYHRPRV